MLWKIQQKFIGDRYYDSLQIEIIMHTCSDTHCDSAGKAAVSFPHATQDAETHTSQLAAIHTAC